VYPSLIWAEVNPLTRVVLLLVVVEVLTVVLVELDAWAVEAAAPAPIFKISTKNKRAVIENNNFLSIVIPPFPNQAL
jgi:hypothetical protein